ncbi:hypothetical protein PR202_ga20670 [Eleusine coracana subsp. coracana]|uniref:GDSL esterase/lipase n=1 Tax=Eleusine coracana subsp. coracana TaxID=191504 RepID=A0AAV5CZC8_ELECO|nr:hypothetical protein PR202_ga20670 [Eleusine coracana subsp. coracana]
MKHVVVLSLHIFLLLSGVSYSTQAKYTSIFSFGDSYTDTGNILIIDGPSTPNLWINKPPYGMTFFGHPTGRVSDGRLVIDFIAEALGLPLLPPALAKNQNFKQGANFAVGGATLRWFDRHEAQALLLTTSEYFGKALFVIGEMGWNDYGLLLVSGKSVGEVQSSHMPRIVETIAAATEKLITDGAKTIVVSGVPPLGCAAGNLNLNLLAKAHNAQLSQALKRLAGKHAACGVRVTSTPPSSASRRRPAATASTVAAACCCGGGGGKYNFDLAKACGMPGVRACANRAAAYVNWDGVHFTEAAYHRVADGWLRGPFANPPILS